jgi:hypothetical protein
MTSQMLTQHLNRPASPMGVWGLVGVLLVAAALAVLFGLIAVTASPILVSMAAALLLGAFLLAKPTWNIWSVLVLGLLVAGVVPIWADALGSKAIWGVSILGLMLMGSALFSAASNPGATRNTPGFVWAALVFMLYAVFTTLVQFHSVGELLGGFKRYFQVFGLLFALCWLAIDEQSIRRWRKLFVIVALVQLPFALYELISLVPLRESLRIPLMVPIDVVAGTFGASIYSGGANAEMATFLIIFLAFMLARRQEKALSSSRLFFLAPLVLAPLFLGETKVVLILLPMMFLVLYRRELLVRPHIALAGLIIGALLTVGAGMAYVSLSKKTLEQQIEQTLRYNVYEKGYGGRYLNRTTVLSFWVERQGAHDPVALVLGNGIGSSHDSSGGHVARRYPTYGIGLTAASTLLWDLGIVGIALFLSILILAWRAAGRLRREATDALVRADAAAIQAVLPLFGFYLIYRLALLETLSFQIVFTALLGYLAWLYRRHARSAAGSQP